jgi:hypothetical protein
VASLPQTGHHPHDGCRQGQCHPPRPPGTKRVHGSRPPLPAEREAHRPRRTPRAGPPSDELVTNPSTTICRSWKRRSSSTSRSKRSKSLRGPTPVGSEPMSPAPRKPKRRPRQHEIAKKAVDGLSRSLQSRSKLVESPFPPRNQTWKHTFWTGTRKPNPIPMTTWSVCGRVGCWRLAMAVLVVVGLSAVVPGGRHNLC